LEPVQRVPFVRTQPFGLVRTVLGVLFIVGMIAACAWILWPFLSAVIWATLLVVATWSPMIALQGWLGGSRRLATLAMTAAVLVAFILPVALTVSAIVEHTDEMLARVEALRDWKMPPPPAWVRAAPLVGEQAAQGWERLATMTPEERRARIEPYRRSVAAWIVHQAGGLAMFFLHLLLTVIIAAAFYANGERVVLGVRAFARRLAGQRGEEMTYLAAQAIRAVALGVVVTAALEALLAGLGLVLASVPFAAFLSALVFVFAVAQAPLLVLLPVVAWLYWKGGSPLVATAFLVWSILIATVDNLLRPVLIKRTARLPLALIFAGVVGGLVAFGAVGLFVGPVVLAVTYTLLAGWVSEAEPRP
jgi:predicted PurR-regulated permease PerM